METAEVTAVQAVETSKVNGVKKQGKQQRRRQRKHYWETYRDIPVGKEGTEFYLRVMRSSNRRRFPDWRIELIHKVRRDGEPEPVVAYGKAVQLHWVDFDLLADAGKIVAAQLEAERHLRERHDIAGRIDVLSIPGLLKRAPAKTVSKGRPVPHRPVPLKPTAEKAAIKSVSDALDRTDHRIRRLALVEADLGLALTKLDRALKQL